MISVEPPGASPCLTASPTLQNPNVPKKALAFQGRIPVAVPCHKATTGTNISGAALITPVKEEAVFLCTFPQPAKPFLFSVASLSSLLSTGRRTASRP